VTYDLHVHSAFSLDSRQPMEGHCARAVEMGLPGLCFTEHLDFDALSLDFYNPSAYFGELNRLREKYAGRLEILAGLEFSEPHQHPRQLEQARGLPYDFVLGSVHLWLGGLFPSQMRDRGMSVPLCFARYWEQVLLMVRHGGFDCVAHLDFPRRYFRCLEYQPEMADEIFRAMVENDLALEINTSSLRKGLDEPMPGEALLRHYAAQGGRYVTLGSDAHSAQELYRDIPRAAALSESLGLVPVRFVGRERVITL